MNSYPMTSEDDQSGRLTAGTFRDIATRLVLRHITKCARARCVGVPRTEPDLPADSQTKMLPQSNAFLIESARRLPAAEPLIMLTVSPSIPADAPRAAFPRYSVSGASPMMPQQKHRLPEAARSRP